MTLNGITFHNMSDKSNEIPDWKTFYILLHMAHVERAGRKNIST